MDDDDNNNVQEFTTPDENEVKLNSYFKYSVNISSFRKLSNFNNIPKDTSDFLSLTDSNLTPFLFKFFSSSTKFLHSDFYKLTVDNFQSLNDKELDFISKYLQPNDFKELIFNHIIENNFQTLNPKEFKKLLSKKFNSNFKDFYLQGLLTKYSLDNFETIAKEDREILWNTIDLSISKFLFLKRAKETQTQINDKSFFKCFLNQNREELFDYFSIAVKNKWSDNIIYFIHNFSHTTNAYLNKKNKVNTSNEIYFEKLFLYYNPEKIANSHLNEQDLNLVYTKLYENLPDKDLCLEKNVEYLQNLELSIYKFVEIAYKKNPDLVKKFLESSSLLLFDKINPSYKLISNVGIANKNSLFTLISFLDSIPFNLQKSFSDNVLIDFLPSILEDKNTFQNILKYSKEESFLFDFIVQSTDILSNKNSNIFIYNLMESYILEGHTENYLMNKLNQFPYESLKGFEKNLDFSISLLKDKHNQCNENSLLNAFNNVLLNKELMNKLQVSSESKSEKKKKI